MSRRVVEEGRSLAEAAEAAGVSERCCAKWVRRYRLGGEAGLLDHPSTPDADGSDQTRLAGTGVADRDLAWSPASEGGS